MKCDTSPDKKEIVEIKLVTVSVHQHLLLHIFNNSRSLATVLPYKVYINRMLQKPIYLKIFVIVRHCYTKRMMGERAAPNLLMV